MINLCNSSYIVWWYVLVIILLFLTIRVNSVSISYYWKRMLTQTF